SAGMPSTRYSLGTPTRRPFTPLPTKAGKSGTASGRLVESLGSWPLIERSRRAASSTVLAIGPAWSSEEAKATTPQREQRPYVGLMPTVPVKAAGWRMEPPVSVAVAPRQSRAATAAADPPEEPPGTSGASEPLRRQGETTLP